MTDALLPLSFVTLVCNHGPLLAMLCAAWRLRRSLGAWPVFLTALFSAVAAQLWLAAAAPPLSVPLSMLDMLLAPSLLFALARSQLISGLRRGAMTQAQRNRWIENHAFATSRAPRPLLAPDNHRRIRTVVGSKSAH